MTRFPSVDRIEAMTGCDRLAAIAIRRILDGRDNPEALPKVARWVAQCYHMPHQVELKMAAVDELLGTWGVEAIHDTSVWDNYHGDVVATYCNAGDSYAGTILYDVSRDAFYATTWADWVETAERNRRYSFA